MKVEFRRSFVRDLQKISEKNVRQRVQQVIEQVETASVLDEIPNLIKLKGEGDYYRIRVGTYRIGIKMEQGIVIFVRCLHRRDIYRYFP
ncbi:MAG: type II toxin-antitoxin system RelE/ParE family toxin [Anaerolineae bacterium]|nr:type II toxin-antitoxin system RelE/ParE family toxin [Anaerolineae bacterium]